MGLTSIKVNFVVRINHSLTLLRGHMGGKRLYQIRLSELFLLYIFELASIKVGFGMGVDDFY